MLCKLSSHHVTDNQKDKKLFSNLGTLIFSYGQKGTFI